MEKLPELKPIEKESEVTLKFPEVEKLAGSILILSEVAYAYPDCKPTFQNVDLSATMESRICIVSTCNMLKIILSKSNFFFVKPIQIFDFPITKSRNVCSYLI